MTVKSHYWRRVAVTTVRERVPEPFKVHVSAPSVIASMFRAFVGDDPREHFVAIYLDAKHYPIGVHVVAIGSATSCTVSPRDVLAPALGLSCTALVVAHNHPSGNPSPSPDDVAVTERLREAAELLGLTMLDHVIVTHDAYTSMAEQDFC